MRREALRTKTAPSKSVRSSASTPKPQSNVPQSKVASPSLTVAPTTAPEAIPLTWAGRIPHIKPAKYADGLPVHELNYLAFKMVLKANRFTSRQSLFDLAKEVGKLAASHGIRFSRLRLVDAPIRIREVLFVDTAAHRFYNNAFILRRRIVYQDGFPISEPEVVFKFRHTDIQKAAETDVRPRINGAYRVKFKAQALPLKGELGGIRMLFSHNVQFPRSSIQASDVFSMEELSKVLPVLERVKKDPEERIVLVNDTIIEEVLQDIGVLDFGFGLKAEANVGIWRTRGEHRPLVGELAYQIKFEDRKEMHLEAMKRAERYFLALQYAVKGDIALNATKTGIVYRLLGNAPTSHE
jgi:hypothetical protein